MLCKRKPLWYNEPMISIYMLTDPTGADTCYVGMTSQPVEARFKQHLIEKVCPPKRRWIQQLAAQRMQRAASAIAWASDNALFTSTKLATRVPGRS